VNVLTAVVYLSLASLEIYAKCLEKISREIIEPKLDDTQCGFRPGRSTEDNFHSPENFLEILGVCQRRRHMLC